METVEELNEKIKVLEARKAIQERDAAIESAKYPVAILYDPSEILAWKTNDKKLAARAILADFNNITSTGKPARFPLVGDGYQTATIPFCALEELMKRLREARGNGRGHHVKVSVKTDSPVFFEFEYAKPEDERHEKGTFAAFACAPRIEK